jgi:glutamate racemase
LGNKIGVIDSGLGGLTVVKQILNRLPKEEVLYFGDTARCPYGNKTVEQIKTYVYDMVHFLVKRGIKALVIACNTATAILCEELKSKLSIPVIGVIEPGARAANKKSKNGHIGVIATTRTIETGVYEQQIKGLNDKTEVFSRACPLLVPMIESGGYPLDERSQIIKASLYPLKTSDIDTLVLGCTHFPLIRDEIARYLEDGIAIVDPAEETVSELEMILRERKIENNQQQTPVHNYYVSGETRSFAKSASAWLGSDIFVEKHAFEVFK